MMESAWQCPEDDDDKNAEQTLNHLLSEVKKRLMAATRGGEEALIKKVYNDFDLNESGSLTMDEVTTMIAKL